MKKVVPSTGETTIFVYDAAGALAAEYSTATPSADPTTAYLTTDHLGSPRVITDDNGEVISRRDFMPFGEELGAGVGARAANQQYSVVGSDNIRQRFTGYEKDDESGLDFAEARMYKNKHGRFTAVDPLLASANGANPQTFNRYIYTGNNPVNHTDPSGLNWCRDSNGIKWTGFDKACADSETEVGGSEMEVTRSGRTNNGYFVRKGQIVIFDNKTGNVRIIRDVPAQGAATAQGQSVASTTGSTSAQTAAGAAAASAAQGTPSGTTSDLAVPCSASDPTCGHSVAAPPPRLEVGASADEVLDAAQTGLELIGMVPGLELADVASGVIDLTRGNHAGAALSAGALLPFGGQAFTATKWARRFGRLGSDATRAQVDEIASTLVDRGYTIRNGGQRGLKEEYLPPLLGGRKGGSYVDITATHPKYGTIRINTVDTLRNGKTPTARERRNAARIRKQIGSGQHLLLIPKRR